MLAVYQVCCLLKREEKKCTGWVCHKVRPRERAQAQIHTQVSVLNRFLWVKALRQAKGFSM